MRILCRNCGHSEETNVDTFVKIIGGALPLGGYWAWVRYLFAGTGFAMPIVIAIIVGGVAMLAFKEQIVAWLVNRRYPCCRCSACNWTA